VWLCSCGKNGSESFSKEASISDSFFTGKVRVEKVPKLDKYKISIWDEAGQIKDRIYTPFEVFAMETGDVNNDGKTDICLGIIKPTPFDSVLKKRLFIFQVDRDYIRPLWLGSRLAYSFDSFTLSKDTEGKVTVIATLRSETGEYFTHLYKWGSFGLTLLPDPNQIQSQTK
jgi:hypothetical protein